jgi:hypothetical protein
MPWVIDSQLITFVYPPGVTLAVVFPFFSM